MTYKDVLAAQDRMVEAKKNYRNAVYDFLLQSIVDAGLADKTVTVKKTGEKGVLQVSETGMFTPYEIKFYPLKKDGDVSRVARGVADLYSSRVLSDKGAEYLQSIFEVKNN